MHILSCEMYAPHNEPDDISGGKEWKTDNMEVKFITFVI